MAHKKGAGSTRNGRDSKGRRLGVKVSGSSFARAGNIIIRQLGTKFHPGEGTYLGRTYSIHARHDGVVHFSTKRGKTYISVVESVSS